MTDRMIKQAGNLQFQLTDTPAQADRDYLRQQIRQFNNQVSPQHRAARQAGGVRPLAIFVRNQQGQIVGGLAGDTYWDWLDVDDLWVDVSLRKRGYGRDLLLAAEAEAKERGCTRAFLKTFSFQARDFYKKFGYRVVGQLEDYPPGHSFYWMRKDFSPAK